MRVAVPSFAVLALAVMAGPLMADGHGGKGVATCHDEANAAAYSGSKSGYSSSYDAALQDCLARGTQHYVTAEPAYGKYTRYSEAEYHAPETYGCIMGHGVMQRGTLICPGH